LFPLPVSSACQLYTPILVEIYPYLFNELTDGAGSVSVGRLVNVLIIV